MKNNFSISWIGLCVAIFLSACSSKSDSVDGPTTIEVDLRKTENLTIDESRIIRLETNDSSIIYDINDAIINDSTIIIYSRSLFKTFDRKGNFIRNISGMGQGVGEYLNIAAIWGSDSLIYLVDSNRKSLLSFDWNGKFVDALHWQTNLIDKEVYGITYLIPAADGNGFYSINTFVDHTYDTNPMFSRFDSDMNFIRNIAGREQSNGSYMPDRMVADVDGKRMFAWEQLKDTLFVLDDFSVKPFYVFDFLDNKFPAEKQADASLNVRLDSFVGGKDVPYASFIKYYQPVGDRIFFSFATADENIFLGMLNRKTNETRVFSLDSDNYAMTFFIKVNDDNLFVSMADKNDAEANPLLYVLPISEL